MMDHTEDQKVKIDVTAKLIQLFLNLVNIKRFQLIKTINQSSRVINFIYIRGSISNMIIISYNIT